MRAPLRPAEFEALPDSELVEHAEFVNGKDGNGRGYIPFSSGTLRARMKQGRFPEPVVKSKGGASSLWTVKQIKKFKKEYVAEQLAKAEVEA